MRQIYNIQNANTSMYVDCAFSIVANQWLNDCLIEINFFFLIKKREKYIN